MDIMHTENSIKVFEMFEKICSIPHGSGNTAAISSFCADFAREHGYRFIKETSGNIIIFADGSKGYEHCEPVILQGHLDMVCDKTADCKKDLTKDPITLQNDGEYIFADKTTLGGDDGIAVAYILALLDDKTIAHPPIEAVLTVDEEVGMLGARTLDTSVLKGKKLINIDSEQEGVLTVSCAGGVRAMCSIPVEKQKCEGKFFKLKIRGLKGGHSGVEINLKRTNAAKLMAQMLHYIYRNIPFNIVSINGGSKENIICNYADAVVCVSDKYKEKFLNSVVKFFTLNKATLKEYEPDLKISSKKLVCSDMCFTDDSTRKALYVLTQIPDGVQAMSPDIENMVQTSLNLGILKTDDTGLFIKFLVRSNAAAGKQALVQKLESFIAYSGGSVEFAADYPAWEYRAKSSLRNTMTAVFKEMYKKEPVVTSIHAGLECGILAGKIDDMDAVSFGPDIKFAHTPNEKMKITSVNRCWEYLKEVLKNLK